MGLFDIEFIKKHVNFGEYKVCVETGTNLGYSTTIMKNIFDEVYTIEIMENLHKKALETFKDSNVKCILGDSGEKINELCSIIKKNCIFYLDAHWSGDNTTDYTKSLWKGYIDSDNKIETGYKGEKSSKPTSKQQVPLEEEMLTIYNTFPYKCVIYIDDIDNFDNNGNGMKDKRFHGEDWSHINLSFLLKVMSNRIIYQYNTNYQLIICLKEI